MRRVAPFNPTDITGCTLWLDGQDQTQITQSSNLVSQWSDKSGSGNHATQSTGGNQPTYSNNGLVFAGSQWLQTNITSFPTAESFFIVFKTSTAVADIFAGTTTTSREVLLYTGTKIFLGRWGTDPAATTPNAGVIPLNTVLIYSHQFTSSAVTFNINGSTTGSGTPPYTYSGTGTSWIGSASYAPNNMYGSIYEIVYYNTSLSKAQAETIEGYLAQKWGLRPSLPGSHAGITSILYPTIRRTGATNMTIQPVTYSTNFSPTSIAGCTLWLDGADPAGSGVLPANNSTLSTWADKSGYGLNMTGASGQPSFLTTAFNGRPTVSFAATQDVSYQVLSNASTALFNSLTNLSVFIVMYIPGTTPNFPVPIALFGKVIIYMRGGSAGGIGSGNLYPWTYNGAGVVYNSNNYISVNNYYICCFQFNTNQSFFMNGDLGTGGPTAFSFGSATNIPIFIGTSTYNTSDGFNGYLSEILVYTSLVTSTQRQQVESYLGQKWGLQSQLPAGHLNATNPAGTPAIVREIYGQIKRTIIPFIVPWTPLKPLSSGVLPWHWFKGDAGLSTTAWINYGVSGSTASNVGTITLANYTQGGTQAGGTNNSCTVSPSGYWRWPGVYQTSYHATFAVFKLNSLTSGQTWTWKGNSTAGRGYTPQYIVTNSSGVFSDYILSQNAFLPLNGVTINPATQFYTHSMVWGSTQALSLVQVGSTVASPNGWTTDYGLGIYDNEYIGFAVAPAQSAGVTMTICELLLFALNSGYGGPVDLTAADVANVQSYLSKKWGV